MLDKMERLAEYPARKVSATLFEHREASMVEAAGHARSRDAATRWPLIVPLVAIGVLAVALLIPSNAVLLLISGVALLGAVISAVHHAEIVAHQLGEPFGT